MHPQKLEIYLFVLVMMVSLLIVLMLYLCFRLPTELPPTRLLN